MASFVLSLVDKVTGPAGQATGAVGKITKGLKDVAAGGGDAGAVLGQIGASLGGMLSKAFPAGPAMSKVVEALSALGPEGQAVAAVLQVVVGVITSVVSTLYDWAAAAVVAAGKRDALIATFDALGEGANAGAKTLAATTALAASLPFVTGKINGWAKSLMAAGIQGAAMEQGVKAIAASTAIMGESGGAATETLIKRFAMAAESGQKVKLDRRVLTQLAAAGVSSDALAAELGVPADKLGTMSLAADKLGEAMQKALVQKGGPALEAMGLTWDSIKAKMDEGIGSLFSGAADDVRPFMTEVKSLFGEFNKGSSTMAAGKGIMTAVLTALFNAATVVVHAIHTGFLTIQIAALKVAIAIAPIVNVIRAIATNERVLKGLKSTLLVIAIVAGLIALPFILAAVGFAVLVAAALALQFAIAAAFYYIIGAVVEFFTYIDSLGPAIRDALVSWATTAYSAAGNFVMGIVNGIASGAGMVIDAVKSLASGALSAFKGVLGIHSPSAVMKVQGNFVAQGAALGIDAGAGRVQAAARSMGADVPASLEMGTRGPGAKGGAGAGRGAGANVTFEKGAIQIDGAGKSAIEITEEMVALVFERLAASQGLMAARP